jgi:cell division protein ZapB
MSKIEELADRIERLLLRYEESQRAAALLTEQVTALTVERDSLRSRLSAARNRIDSLIERLPVDVPAAPAVPPGVADSTVDHGNQDRAA